MTGPEVELRIEGIAGNGEGYGVAGRHRVRVAATLPGERVRARRDGDSHELVAVIEASPERVDPGCGVFPRCGGCAWRHMSAAAQGEQRLEALRRALPPALRGVEVRYTASEARDGWRTRARLGWRVRGSVVSLGFRERASRSVVAIDHCPVLHPALDAALPAVGRSLAAVSERGEVSLSTGRGGGCVVSIHPEGALFGGAFAVCDALVGDGLLGAALWPPGATVPVTAGEPRPMIEGPDGAPLALGIDGFAQAHSALNAALAEHVAREADARGRAVLELYAGAGNFTVLLGRDAKRVTAVEGDPGSVAALEANLRARGVTNVRVVRGDAGEHPTTGRPEVLVLDPPRQGARGVCEAVAAAARKGEGPRRVVYVSCDPPTLGRDLEALSGAFELRSLAAFEMFPQTPHVEAVAMLVARSRPRGGA